MLSKQHSKTPIIRLRGSGKQLIWPAAAMADCREIRDAVDASMPPMPTMAREWFDNTERAARAGAWFEGRRATRMYAARTFAEAQGWSGPSEQPRSFADLFTDPTMRRETRREERKRTYDNLGWMLRGDVVDHPEFFQVDSKRYAAVVHLFSREIALDHIPDSVTVDQLPFSWYHPWTSAYVLRGANK